MIVFDMFREVWQRSKQLEIFLFLPRISYFHHNGHSGSYPTGLPCQNGNFAVVAHIFLKFSRRSRATFRGLAGHFWPAGHRLGTTGIYVYYYIVVYDALVAGAVVSKPISILFQTHCDFIQYVSFQLINVGTLASLHASCEYHNCIQIISVSNHDPLSPEIVSI